MIGYVEGRLLAVLEKGCLVLTEGGVGYEVRLGEQTLARLPAKGQPVALYVLTQVREDALELYGFESLEERQTFEQLLSISKLGPKTALAILACYRPHDLARIAAEEDVAMLARVPGIGKKSAERILFELKFKIKPEHFAPAAAGGSGAVRSSVFRDALDGLVNLGYAETEIRPLLVRILEEEPDLDVQAALRAALKALAARK